MSLNLGGGKSSSSSRQGSESSSSSYGVSGDVSSSISNAVSGGISEQNVFGSDIFSQLFGNASGAAGRVAANAPQLMQVAQQLFSGGSQFLQGLGGSAGDDYLNARLTGPNQQLEDQIALLKQDASSLFSDELNPAITSRSVAGGTLGGGRQGVAQGIAAGKVTDAFVRGAADLRSADLAQRDQIAQNVAMNSINAASTGLGALPGLLDVAERGANEELGAYSSLSSILGGPTVLTQANDFSRSTAQSAAEAFSRQFGESTSKSWGYSRSRAANFDFGFGLS